MNSCEHRPRDAESDAGHADGVEALHGEGIERPRLAAQRRVLARGAERFRHEQVGDAVGIGGRAAQADGVPCVDQRRLLGGEQERADRRLAAAIAAQRAVRLDHVGVRAHPARVAAAAGEVPGAAEPIAARHARRPRSVGRPPGHDGARVGEDRPRHALLQKGCNQRRAVGDEHIPGQRAIVPGNLLDRPKVGPRLRLVAAGRARQEHAQEPRSHAAAPAAARECVACLRWRRTAAAIAAPSSRTLATGSGPCRLSMRHPVADTPLRPSWLALSRSQSYLIGYRSSGRTSASGCSWLHGKSSNADSQRSSGQTDGIRLRPGGPCGVGAC